MTVLTRHSRQQKEAVRKRGPSLRGKAQQLGLKGSIRVIVIHEDPTHGVWHVVKHCPRGLAFPDINGLLEEHDRTGQAPRVRPCPKYALSNQNVRKISVGCLQDEVSGDETVTMSMGSTASDGADIEDVGNEDWMDGAADVAVRGFEEGPGSLEGHLDDDRVMVDQMIQSQLEETGSQMHRRLLRCIWKS